MKIAQVICFFGERELSSGAVAITNDIVTSLTKRGHKCYIFSGIREAGIKDRELYTQQYNNIGEWWYFNIEPFMRPDSKENYYNELANSYFRKFLLKTRPDIVHFHAIQGLGAGLIEVTKEEGIPFVVHLHDWWWYCPYLFTVTKEGKKCLLPITYKDCNCLSKTFLKERYQILNNVVKNIDYFIAVSDFLKKTYIQFGIPESKIIVCPNPVTVFEKENRHKHSSTRRFAYFGGDSCHKGYHILKKAVSGLKGRFIIDYYGFNNGRSCYKLFNIIRPSFKKQRYHPTYKREDLPAILSNVDVVIVPSLMLESFSLVVREALSQGVPVISASSGGPEEVIKNDVTGWLFKRGDWHQLRTIMQDLINNPKKVQLVRENIQRTNFSFLTTEDYVMRLEEIYLKILNVSNHELYNYPEVSIVIVNHNGKVHLEECLRSLYAQSFSDFEIIIVDNGSTDGSVEFIRDNYPQVRLVENKINRGFCRGNNDGISISKGRYLFLLNNDTVVDKECLKTLYEFLSNSDENCFAVFPKVLFYHAPKFINCAEVVWNYKNFWRDISIGTVDIGQLKNPKKIFGSMFVAVLMKKDIFEKMGLFDEALFTYGEDFDVCYQTNLFKYDIYLIPQAVVYHKFRASSQEDIDPLWSFYLYLRNYFYVIFKNISVRQLWRSKRFLLKLYFTNLQWGYKNKEWKRFWLAIKVPIALIKMMVPLLKKRRKIQRNRRCSDSDFWDFAEREPHNIFYYCNRPVLSLLNIKTAIHGSITYTKDGNTFIT